MDETIKFIDASTPVLKSTATPQTASPSSSSTMKLVTQISNGRVKVGEEIVIGVVVTNDCSFDQTKMDVHLHSSVTG